MFVIKRPTDCMTARPPGHPSTGHETLPRRAPASVERRSLVCARAPRHCASFGVCRIIIILLLSRIVRATSVVFSFFPTRPRAQNNTILNQFRNYSLREIKFFSLCIAFNQKSALKPRRYVCERVCVCVCVRRVSASFKFGFYTPTTIVATEKRDVPSVPRVLKVNTK